MINQGQENSLSVVNAKDIKLMKCYSYVVARDYGFAPNPFGPYCTLATCKPDIRNSALVGDIIVGSSSRAHNPTDSLVYVMHIDEKIDFNQYSSDPRFKYKKPILNGSLKQMYGDNIYNFDSTQNDWIQLDSHHSHPDGSPNLNNKNRDLKSCYVLISKYFWYFGRNHLVLPDEFVSIYKHGRGYKSKCFTEEFLVAFLAWLECNVPMGYRGDPYQFDKFQRYDGIS